MTETSVPLRVCVFFSGGCSALKYLSENDPNYGEKYQVVGAFTDNHKAVGVYLVRDQRIPIWVIDFRRWLRHHNRKFNDLAARAQYFTEVLGHVADFKPQLIMLSGFMLRITEPLLGRFPIINVHPADLRILGADGKPKYRGADVVADAIADGATQTCSTIHVVTTEVDCGKIICVSDPLIVPEGVDPKAHQEDMKWLCDGPAYAQALAMIAGRFAAKEKID